MKKPRRRTSGTLSPKARTVADAFFAHKKKHPEPVPADQMTPLQRRMQSGGGVTTEEFTGVVERAAKIRPKKKTFPRD